MCAERLEQSDFFGTGLAQRHHLGILKHRDGALIGAVHDVLVGPLEIESIVERLAHPRIVKLWPPHIDKPALRAGRRIVGQHVFLDAAVFDRREIVARRPDARGELFVEQIGAGGKAFERDIAVAIIFKAYDVEIVLAARYRQIRARPKAEKSKYYITSWL